MRFSSVSFAAALAAGAFGQAPPKNMTFSPTLKSVAVFRDGFGYYVREGQVKLENGWATTDLVPSAIKGTVRFYTLDKADKIDTVVIGKENRLDFSNPGQIKGLLTDKIGLRITVVTKTGQRFDGNLARVLDDMLLIQVGDAFNAIPYDQVQSILLPGFPVRIKVNTANPNKVVGIGVAYLQEGIRWDPSYVLDVHHGEGNLSLRASMQNTTEKLNNSDVFFVVGSPYVANRGVADMLAQIPAVPDAKAGKDKDGDKKDPDAKREPEGEAEAAASAGVTNASIAREEAGELYYYEKPGLSLDPTDVAMVSIFDATVPVAPRYEWNADGDEVAYLLDLKNLSHQPLTTGPVFVLEDGKAIGQETIKYTPAGANAEIRLSRGIGLKVDKKESEVSRNAPVKVGNTNYIPVVLRGVLTITNYKSEPATVKVTRTVRGKVDKLSDGGTIRQTQILNGEPNPINDLEWKIEVPAGATKTITYTFETYMSAERAGSPPVPSSEPVDEHDQDGDRDGH